MEKVIGIRVTEEDKQILEKEAAKYRISLSAYIRQQLFQPYE